MSAYVLHPFALLKLLAFKPGVLLNAIERNKWQKDRCLLYISLVFGVGTIVFILANL